MRKVTKTKDFNGLDLGKGDTVSTLNGQMTGKISEIALEGDDTAFVRLRPLHTPFSKGIWHAADRVQRVAVAKKRNS